MLGHSFDAHAGKELAGGRIELRDLGLYVLQCCSRIFTSTQQHQPLDTILVVHPGIVLPPTATDPAGPWSRADDRALLSLSNHILDANQHIVGERKPGAANFLETALLFAAQEQCRGGWVLGFLYFLGLQGIDSAADQTNTTRDHEIAGIAIALVDGILDLPRSDGVFLQAVHVE